MTRTMYDSIRAVNIPANAQIVAGYIDTHPGGENPWSVAEWVSHQSALWLPIAVFVPSLNEDPRIKATNNASYVEHALGLPKGSSICLDVEANNWAQSDAFRQPWAETITSAGYSPTLYTSHGNWIKEPFFDDDWIADYNLTAADPINGAVAVQYSDNGPNGTDVSSVWVDTWPRRPAVAPIPVPTPGGNPMSSGPLPAAALPLKGHSASWNANNAELDVWMLGNDGHLYHKWYHVTDGWHGPEVLDQTL